MKFKICKSLVSLILIFCLIFTAIFAFSPLDSVHGVAIIATVTVGVNPLGLVYDNATGEVFVSNGGSGSVSVIDDTTNTVVATVGVGREPWGLAYDFDKGEIWAANSDENFVSVISDSTHTLITTVQTTTVTAAYPQGACYDFATGEIYVANGFEQNVAVVATSDYSLVTKIPIATPSYPTDAAYDFANGEIYVTNQQIDTVSAISESSKTVVANINVGDAPQSLCYDPATGEIYVANFGSGTVSVISTATHAVVATVAVGTGPSSVAYDSGQDLVWVTNQGSNTVTAISDATHTVVGSIAVGNAPSAVCYDSGTNEIFVANSADGTVSVLSASGPFPSPTTTPPPTVMEIPTFLDILVSPNPVGVGQAIYMQAFLTKPTPTAGVGGAGDLYAGITIDITPPTGTVTTLGPFIADSTGGVPSLEYIPATTGNYTFQAFYPGQTITTAGAYFNAELLPSDSPEVVVNVQEEPVNPLSSPALPNEFWNFPIQAPNWGWSSLAGDWLGGSSYDATGNFNPYTMAPTTAHIMWTQQTDFGGQPGGPIPGDLEHNFVTTAILVSTWSGIIMQGRLYYNEYNTMGRLTSWKCIDLRTGELIWERDPGIGPAESGTESVAGQSTAESLLRGSVYAQRSMQEYGSTALLYSQCPDRTTWRLYSAFDGTYLGNITGVPRRGSFIRDQNTANPNVGQQLGYEISDGNLLMWNETLCFAGGVTTGAGPYTLRIPTTMPYSAGYQWNVTIPTTYQGKVISPALSIAEVTQDVILLRSAPTLSTQSSAGSEIDAAYNARTGDLMWIKNNTVPFQHSLSLAGAHDDVYVIIDKDALAAYGYSMSTGNQLWGPTEFPGNALSHVAISSDVAYGQIYIFDIGGYCRAINITSGELAWTYYPPSSEYNTPYGVYPIWTQSCQAIADGMIFLGVGRLYDPPLFMNATRIALNCTTGELVWGALGFMSKGVSPVGDGFLVAWDCYDATLYAFSKGPTEITASVQNSVTSLGNSVLITGRVTDVSPGTQQSVQKYNFPDGVPCVPDSEMTDWMAYVYKQQPIPTDVTGVPVTISVLDANNNCYEIGTTTTDAAANGFYSFQWTPEIPGKYTVYATYGGSESYWSSSTETAFVVDDVAATQPPAEYPVPMDYTISIIGAAIAMIIAVAIATILILRKR